METPLSTKRKHDDNEEEHQDSTTTPADNANESGVVKKQKKKKNVRFDDVTVYYFARSQGFVSVPSQGTITLGMESEHSHVEQYSVADFSRLRRALHKSILRERKLLPPTSSTTVENDSDEDEPLPVDDYYFIQPIATRQRRTLLKQAGLVKIDMSEKHDLALIRRSREVCGCSCTRETGGCQPSTCDCYLNGIACQVDRLTFPCPCATMLCKNPLGRLEFNQSRVRNHYFDTISRLEAEKNQEAFVRSLVQSDDQSAIASLLSSIVARIELEEADIASILQSVVSSVGDSSPLALTIPPATTSCATPLANGKEHSSQPARACHASSLRRKTSSSLPSPPMISTELS